MFLSLLINGVIVDQIQTTMTSEEAIALDTMLRKNDLYDDEVEIAVTYEV